MDCRDAMSSLSRALTRTHSDVVYRNYRCTGASCPVAVVMMEGVDAWCGTAGCRGTMTPRRRVPTRRVVEAALARIGARRLPAESALQGTSSGVSPSQKAQNPGPVSSDQNSQADALQATFEASRHAALHTTRQHDPQALA